MKIKTRLQKRQHFPKQLWHWLYQELGIRPHKVGRYTSFHRNSLRHLSQGCASMIGAYNGKRRYRIRFDEEKGLYVIDVSTRLFDFDRWANSTVLFNHPLPLTLEEMRQFKTIVQDLPITKWS